MITGTTAYVKKRRDQFHFKPQPLIPMKYLFNYFAISLLILCFSQKLEAQNIISKPGTYQSVVDEAGILNTDEKNALKRKLDAFESQTGNELIVVTVNSLMGTTVELYASKLFNEWGIGKKGLDNGILLLIAIKDRRMRIETGYGLEEQLTDTECARLLEEILKPNFKIKNYYEGIEIATNYIIKELNKDFNKEQFALKSVQNIDKTDFAKEKTDFAIEKTARAKDSTNPWLIFWACFAFQLGIGILLIKLAKKREILKDSLTFAVFCVSFFHAMISFVIGMTAIEENWSYSTNNSFIAQLTLITVVIYFLTLLRILFCALVSFGIAVVTLVFTDKFEIYLTTAIVLSILFIVLYKMGKFKFLEGGLGSSYTGSGSSYSNSSYSDSSSGDSSSGDSYGGGSSGGGGASDSW